MKKIFLIVLILIALGLAFTLYTNKIKRTSYPQTLTIGEKEFHIAVADSPEEQELGLGNVKSMPTDAGMLFIFEKPDRYGFWMKDTLIPLDMLWIDGEKKIIHIEKNVLPDSYPKVYTPITPALYVLELNSGSVEKNNLSVGEKVDFNLK